MANINLFYIEDDECNKFLPYSVQDTILDKNYPNYCLTNLTAFSFGRVAFCTFPDTLDASEVVHIHENMIVNFISVDETKVSNNSSIQIDVEATAKNFRVLSNSISATCVANKVTALGVKDVSHDVTITEDSYIINGVTKYGLGIWVNMTGYEYLTIQPMYTIGLLNVPIHKAHFKSQYYVEYLCDATKVNETNLINLETALDNTRIANGVYESQLHSEQIADLEELLSKVPSEYTQNSVYYSNTYIPVAANTEEVIAPYSIRGTFSNKITVLDTINNTFKVLQNGYYAIQLSCGFYSTNDKSTQVQLEVYKNTSPIKELEIYEYLESGKRCNHSSNIAILHLTTTDFIELRLIWSSIDILVGNDTFMSIYPVQLD